MQAAAGAGMADNLASATLNSGQDQDQPTLNVQSLREQAKGEKKSNSSPDSTGEPEMPPMPEGMPPPPKRVPKAEANKMSHEMDRSHIKNWSSYSEMYKHLMEKVDIEDSKLMELPV